MAFDNTMQQRLKIFRIFFSLTALLFIAKPFLGFGAFYHHMRPKISYTVLVKSFTKRRPETLEDADEKVRFVHELLSKPMFFILPAIAFLLATLMPDLPGNLIKLTKSTLSRIINEGSPTGRTYLLTGKLSI